MVVVVVAAAAAVVVGVVVVVGGVVGVGVVAAVAAMAVMVVKGIVILKDSCSTGFKLRRKMKIVAPECPKPKPKLRAVLRPRPSSSMPRSFSRMPAHRCSHMKIEPKSIKAFPALMSN